MRRVLKTRSFRRWARGAGLGDELLRQAVAEMASGLIDADLGGGLFKKRVALSGSGKRGGARTLVATNRSDRWYFLGGFLKSEQENLRASELRAFRALASVVLNMTDPEIKMNIATDELEEI